MQLLKLIRLSASINIYCVGGMKIIASSDTLGTSGLFYTVSSLHSRLQQALSNNNLKEV